MIFRRLSSADVAEFGAYPEMNVNVSLRVSCPTDSWEMEWPKYLQYSVWFACEPLCSTVCLVHVLIQSCVVINWLIDWLTDWSAAQGALKSNFFQFDNCTFSQASSTYYAWISLKLFFVYYCISQFKRKYISCLSYVMFICRGKKNYILWDRFSDTVPLSPTSFVVNKYVL